MLKQYSKLPPPKDCHFKQLVGRHLGFGNLKKFLQKLSQKTHTNHIFMYNYCGGKAKWTTLGFFFMKKIIEKKCRKKKCVFLFFFSKKNYRKKMSQKVTKLFSKKKTPPSKDATWGFRSKKVACPWGGSLL